MNEYTVRIPYFYSRYGTLTASVYAESFDEATLLAHNYSNRYAEDYEESDYDGDNVFEFSDMEVELTEEGVLHPNESNNTRLTQRTAPEYLVPDVFAEDMVYPSCFSKSGRQEL